MIRLSIALLVGLLLSACGSSTLGPSQPVREPPAPLPAATETGGIRVDSINLVFPAKLGEFSFATRRRFRATTEGDLLTYASGAAYADIAIYDNARREIGSGPESVAVKIEFEQSRQSFVARWLNQPQSTPQQILREGVFPNPADPNLLGFQEAVHRGGLGGTDYETRFLLTGFRDKFIRVELRAASDVAAQRATDLDGFLRALAELLAKP